MTALAACHRARAAWERTQPQYVIDLYPALDEQPGSTGAPPAPSLPAGLLIEGWENRPDTGGEVAGRERRPPALNSRRPPEAAASPAPFNGAQAERTAGRGAAE